MCLLLSQRRHWFTGKVKLFFYMKLKENVITLHTKHTECPERQCCQKQFIKHIFIRPSHFIFHFVLTSKTYYSKRENKQRKKGHELESRQPGSCFQESSPSGGTQNVHDTPSNSPVSAVYPGWSAGFFIRSSIVNSLKIYITLWFILT